MQGNEYTSQISDLQFIGRSIGFRPIELRVNITSW